MTGIALAPVRSWIALLAAPLAAAALVVAAPLPAAADDGGDRVSFGNDVTVRAGEEISGDLVVFGGNADVYGKVDGDAVVMGGDLHIYPSGEVDGSTVAFGGAVTDDSAQPGHHHHGGSGVVPPPVPSITIGPIVTPIPIVPPVPESESHGPATGWIGFLVVLGVLSLLAFAIAPGTVRSIRDQFLQRPAVASLVGFTWPFLLTAVAIALCLTVIGIVLLPAVVVALVIGYLLGRAAVAQMLGRRLFEVANVMEPAPLATAAVGLLIITVVEGFLPLWMGIVLEACVSAVALGAAIMPLAGYRRFHATAPVQPAYMPPPTPAFTPPSPPPPPGPPAVPQ